MKDFIRRKIREGINQTITVYHGTNPKFVNDIKLNGLISNMGYNNSNWFMVSTDFDSALFHATGSEDTSPVYVFEFQVPITNEKWEGYPYFWPAYNRSDKSKWFSLKQELPSNLITKLHEVPYSEWLKIKSTKNF
jgi:hypothetical protein